MTTVILTSKIYIKFVHGDPYHYKGSTWVDVDANTLHGKALCGKEGEVKEIYSPYVATITPGPLCKKCGATQKEI